ncbi:alpha/beta fold hydrolase [Streptomyces sp. NPDC058304]|uniref:alpha/beta fold hydrolase n=1 Tax=Streptomyces sp. NPDC058304 TaxID=3346437 RepID=UPI0036F0527C
MARARVNGVDLYYEVVGEGEPLVLVHGSWVDHENWQLVVPHLTHPDRYADGLFAFIRSSG